jgi:hypothetical protein
MTIPRPHNSNGVVLIVTLAFIVIVAVLAVGLADTLRTERSAVRTHLERQRATSMAQHGTDIVMSRIRQFTVDPPKASGETEDDLDARTRHWVSQPGRLLIANPNKPGAPKLIDAEVPLSSGLPDPRLLARDEDLVDFFPPNLNESLLLDPDTHLITEEVAGGNGEDGSQESTTGTVQMPVRWVYVRQDGTLVRTGNDADWDDLPSTDDKANPLVGRFAFWADDESTKINYNLAWTRDAALNKQPPGHPTRVDLRALRDFKDVSANELHRYVTADDYKNIGRFFNTPFDARFGASPELLQALNTNRFNLTHYNHEPDTTYYARSRMVLTTQLSNAVLRDKNGQITRDKNGKVRTRPFLDILKRPNDTSTAYIDPGEVGKIDGNKLSAVISILVNNYLKKNDWPMADRHSLQEKYYGTYVGVAREQRLAQLALNIIDYVRSAESRKEVVEPIRGKYINGKFTGDFVDGTIRGAEDTFKGLVRAPHITEMAIWQSETAVAGKGYRVFAFAEVFLPPEYGIKSLNLEEWQLYYKTFGEQPVVNRSSLSPTASIKSPVFVLEAVGDAAKTIMKPGDYRTLVYEVWRNSKISEPIPLRTAITLRGGSGMRIDVAPIGDPKDYKSTVPQPLNYTVQSSASWNDISSYETADPRVNGVAKDWILSRSVNTLGRENNAWRATVGQSVETAGPHVPQQDVDRNGKVSAASLRMPYPYGHPNNPTGRVRSSGELGVIHTGIEGSSLVQSGGTPWRTLRLQPSNQFTVMPDWAFMDLFTPPVDVPVKAAALFAPHGNAAGGRVNMNASPEPFFNSSYKLVRIDPLAAVLYKSRKSSTNPSLVVTESEARTLARNIYERRLANNGKAYGSTSFPCYESPGEVTEIKGIADGGEESEELIREIANLITARGNTFAVYSIGQSLQQTPTGRIIVTAEQRQHVLVERYTDEDGMVRLGTVYFRNLIP